MGLLVDAITFLVSSLTLLATLLTTLVFNLAAVGLIEVALPIFAQDPLGRGARVRGHDDRPRCRLGHRSATAALFTAASASFWPDSSAGRTGTSDGQLAHRMIEPRHSAAEPPL
ncbi:hypothetical protein [Amycolatopsis sp. NPDC059657]|uniref:hypothetical protein n=1 Tax=Amycolatopsis sp. NPDC059657 TaxID=3346899 RepID=UPI003670FFE6